MSKWLSEKGVRFVLAPKRGMCTDINPDVAQPLTANGQMNWTGTFVSPDIVKIERPNVIGGGTPTVIYLTDGRIIEYDGYTVKEIKKIP